MSLWQKLGLLALVVALLAGCEKQNTLMACEPVGALEPVCGLQAPEDIEVTPDGSALVISQFGGMKGGVGSLALFDPATDQASLLFPLGQAAPGAGEWGDSTCPGMPGNEFAPHGIHLSQRADGRWQLLVVNHGGRESVEFFELNQDDGHYRVHWRGCAVLPPPSFLNDVVALPDGGFLVTHMYAKDSVLGPLKAIIGRDSGFVWHWSPGADLRKLPGGEGPFPNGIQLSPDGSTVYLNLYFGGIRKLDLATGEQLAEIPISHADNDGWLPDGRLVVTSHIQETLLPELCMDVHQGACSLRFQIIAVDPQTLDQEVLLDQRGAPMGAGTIAQQLGDTLYVGSYAGDRLLRIPMAALPILME